MLIYSHEYVFKNDILIIKIPSGWLIENRKRTFGHGDIFKRDVIKISITDPPEFLGKGWVVYYNNLLCVRYLERNYRRMVDVDGNVGKLENSLNVKKPELYLSQGFDKDFPKSCVVKIIQPNFFSVFLDKEEVKFDLPLSRILHVVTSHDELTILVITENEFVIVDNPLK